jgi:hypothetical protein
MLVCLTIPPYGISRRGAKLDSEQAVDEVRLKRQPHQRAE